MISKIPSLIRSLKWLKNGNFSHKMQKKMFRWYFQRNFSFQNEDTSWKQHLYQILTRTKQYLNSRSCCTTWRLLLKLQNSCRKYTYWKNKLKNYCRHKSNRLNHTSNPWKEPWTTNIHTQMKNKTIKLQTNVNIPNFSLIQQMWWVIST